MLTAPLMLAGLLFSCKPEQSELNLETLPGTATVTGKVEYTPGAKEINGAIVQNHKEPVVDHTVEIKVLTEAYTNSGEEISSDNYRTFRATTDEKGRYTISVPVGYQPITAYITALPFIDKYNILDHEKNIVSLDNAVFKHETTDEIGDPITLMDQNINEKNIVMGTDKDAEDFALNQKVSIEGTVFIPAELSDSARLRDTVVAYGKTQLEINVIVRESETKSTELTYNVTTSADGQYRLDMMLPNNCWEENVLTTFTVKKKQSLDVFSHYFREKPKVNESEEGEEGGEETEEEVKAEPWQTQKVDVLVNGATGLVRLTESHQLIPVNMPDITVSVVPVYPKTVKGIDPYEEDGIEYHNPMGWDR